MVFIIDCIDFKILNFIQKLEPMHILIKNVNLCYLDIKDYLNLTNLIKIK